MTPTVGFAVNSAFTISCKQFFFVTVAMDPSLGSGTYYVCVLDAPSAPTDGTDLSQTAASPPTAARPRSLAILPVVHASGSAESFTISAATAGFPLESGYKPLSSGVVVYLSSGVPTSVAASAHLSLVMAGTL